MGCFTAAITINAWINVLVYSIAMGLGFGLGFGAISWPFRRWQPA